MSEVVQLHAKDPLTGQLQDELYEVICRSKYDHLSLAATIGILEFLKWNLINRSD
jgi:hypothetical protein